MPDFVPIDDPDARYKVHALGKDTSDIEKDNAGNDTLVRSRELLIDPLLSPDDPFYPDIDVYEPGEAERFERVWPIPFIPPKEPAR